MRKQWLLSLGLVVLVSCASTKSIAVGPEVEAEVQQVLESSPQGEAALANGRAVYWLPAKALGPERTALVSALREAPYVRRSEEAAVPRDVEVVFESDTRIVAWLRTEVFEAACPAGTLHVERVEFHGGKETPWYRISVIQGNRVLFAGVKRSPAIDGAWRRLSQAAKSGSTLQIDGGGPSGDRPLASMRDIGIDFRGIER